MNKSIVALKICYYCFMYLYNTNIYNAEFFRLYSLLYLYVCVWYSVSVCCLLKLQRIDCRMLNLFLWIHQQELNLVYSLSYLLNIIVIMSIDGWWWRLMVWLMKWKYVTCVFFINVVQMFSINNELKIKLNWSKQKKKKYTCFSFCREDWRIYIMVWLHRVVTDGMQNVYSIAKERPNLLHFNEHPLICIILL